MDLIHRSQQKQLKSTKEMAIASAHGTAFHRGLGEPLHPTSFTPLAKYLSHDAIGAYSTLAYRKPNVAIVANGADHSELNKWVGEYFKGMRTEPADGVPPMQNGQTKYFGGEERIAHGSGNTMVLAFPGSSSFTGGFYKPEIAVLAALLGGKSAIKWSPGFSLLAKASTNRALDISTTSAIYSDAGLLYVTLNGSATAVKDAAQDVVSTIKSIASGNISTEDFKKARAQAKFQELEYGQEPLAGLELTGAGLVQEGKPYQLDESAKAIGDVSEDKVKKVDTNLHHSEIVHLVRAMANHGLDAGGQDSPRVQGISCNSGRSVPTSLRRRHRSQSVKSIAMSFKQHLYQYYVLVGPGRMAAWYAVYRGYYSAANGNGVLPWCGSKLCAVHARNRSKSVRTLTN